MIEYLLVLHICNNIDGDCSWTRAGRWLSEQQCTLKGLSVKPPGSQFKCVMQQRTTGNKSGENGQTSLCVPPRDSEGALLAVVQVQACVGAAPSSPP
jgi:hypothetical protein